MADSAVKKLARLRGEREVLDAREAELRREAAGEIGAALLQVGADAIEPAKLAKIVRQVVKLGEDEALKRLERVA
ncbi:DUF6437 family protein [Sphingomonas sp. BIUV-7]|uniref:DUF6437 family protein n=1 Tax=Sphingomonas natans TaxID=3063330 RepID=A0ABT8Y8Q5_9SPHN|nr:DUF6437 family protein [Sphingomonas sp. BIUV-7]MDO6414357.1 DUF6437 family protein [Sphingomonas sp. BIUV-7]